MCIVGLGNDMAWDRNLWGVEFTGGVPGDKPLLIGTARMRPSPQSQYAGEPTRAILFTTRELARAWCRSRKEFYKVSGTCCEKWKFTPVRVREIVKKVPNV